MLIVVEIGSGDVVAFQPLQLGEIYLRAKLDRVVLGRDGHIVFDQCLILVIVLGKIIAELDHPLVADIRACKRVGR